MMMLFLHRSFLSARNAINMQMFANVFCDRIRNYICVSLRWLDLYEINKYCEEWVRNIIYIYIIINWPHMIFNIQRTIVFSDRGATIEFVFHKPYFTAYISTSIVDLNSLISKSIKKKKQRTNSAAYRNRVYFVID